MEMGGRLGWGLRREREREGEMGRIWDGKDKVESGRDRDEVADG